MGISLLLVLFPIFSRGQADTLSDGFRKQFEENLDQLEENFAWMEQQFNPGRLHFEKENEFYEGFKELEFPFFQQLEPGAELIFNFLQNLPAGKKRMLVLAWFQYEKKLDEALADSNLPLEIKYLVPVISAMNARAKGKVFRAGLMQLSHFQAVLNGLTVSRLVDERFDTERSVETAVRELRNNRELFGNNELALAAYFMGKVKLRNIMALVADDNVSITNYLPAEFRETIAGLQAMAVFLRQYRFRPDKTILAANKPEPDTVWTSRMMHFKQVEEVIGISAEQLRFYNPQYNFSIVPGNGTRSGIVLPAGKRDDFLIWLDSICNYGDSSYFQLIVQNIEYPPAPGSVYRGEPVKNLVIDGKTKIRYRLKTGDVLGIIAEKYEVRTADLKYWNNIVNERKIQAGKYLDIFVDDDRMGYFQQLEKESRPVVPGKSENGTVPGWNQDMKDYRKLQYVVKSGESPFVIAKKYEGITPEMILDWNNIDDARKIQVGQKLILYVK